MGTGYRSGRPVGQPWSLSPEKKTKLLDSIRAGNFRSAACGVSGIPDRTFKEWMAKGRDKPRSKYGEFRREVLEAEKSAEVIAVALVRKASEKNWKAAAWWLQTRFNRWKKAERVEHTGPKGGPVEVLHGLSDDALDKLEGMLAGGARGGAGSEGAGGEGGPDTGAGGAPPDPGRGEGGAG